MMLLAVAWRNLWRSKTRSFLVIGAIILGIWSLVFMASFVQGMIYSYIDSAILYQTSHIQIHHPKYSENRDIEYVVENADAVLSNIRSDREINNFSKRLLINGMLSSAKTSRGAVIKGVEADQEMRLTHLEDKLLEGNFLDAEVRNPIVLSKIVADKLNVRLRNKVVLTFQDIHGDLTSGAFRVVGIFDTGNRRLDELTAFAHYADMRRLAGLPPGSAHEIAFTIGDVENVDAMVDKYRKAHPDDLVESYKEISPDLELFKSQLNLNLIIMTTIVMLALIFGIINTMLMAVLERIKELGMLMAIGMNKVRVFFMVVIETVLIAIVGAPLGLAVGYLTVRYLNHAGIDLSRWSKGLAEFGMSNIVYPVLDTDAYLVISLGIMITAVLGSIYPSVKAIRLRPVEALRKI